MCSIAVAMISKKIPIPLNRNCTAWVGEKSSCTSFPPNLEKLASFVRYGSCALSGPRPAAADATVVRIPMPSAAHLRRISCCSLRSADGFSPVEAPESHFKMWSFTAIISSNNADIFSTASKTGLSILLRPTVKLDDTLVGKTKIEQKIAMASWKVIGCIVPHVNWRKKPARDGKYSLA